MFILLLYILNRITEKNNTAIGFNSSIDTLQYNVKATREDLVKYGEMPFEFMGRISNLVQLNQHTKESLYNIFKYSNISPILSEKNKLSKQNIELVCSDDYLKSAAIKALKLKIGGRSLKSIVEQSIKEARWEILNNPNKYSSLTLTSETVENPKKYILK